MGSLLESWAVTGVEAARELLRARGTQVVHGEDGWVELRGVWPRGRMWLRPDVWREVQHQQERINEDAE
jgi:hypothetical protein